VNLIYVLKEGFSGFRRAKLAAAGSILTIMISLLLLGMFYVAARNTARLVESIREKVEMEAFLEMPVANQQVNEIQKQLVAIAGIDHIQLITKDEAAKIFKQEFGEDVGKVLDFNPLPPSFKIFLKDGYRTSAKAAEIHDKILQIKGIENIAYRKELLEFIDSRAKTLYTIGLVLGCIIGISAVFLVSNTIRLTIYAKRKSIQTMKLVGASRWTVRAPFLIEGVIQGLVGGCVAAAMIYYVVMFALALVSSELAQFVQIEFSFYLFLMTLGALLGFFGSAISVRRFIGETVAG
jgi:cell division transport system permease protein